MFESGFGDSLLLGNYLRSLSFSISYPNLWGKLIFESVTVAQRIIRKNCSKLLIDLHYDLCICVAIVFVFFCLFLIRVVIKLDSVTLMAEIKLQGIYSVMSRVGH